ncbi:hypothetical protein [Nostoc sp.]
MKSPKFRVLLAVAGHLARAKLQDRPQGTGINLPPASFKFAD